MKTTNILLSLPLLLLSVAGCTSDEQGDGPVTNGKGEYAVNFSGNINLTQTKANESPKKEDVATGVKAKISTFEKDNTSTAIVNAQGYTVDASTAGQFNGDGDYVMYLAKGSYDFYAVSANITTSADGIPAFTSGTSADLQNRVDYIYAKSKNISIPGASDAGNNITLSFEHKAVRITIDVKSGIGLELTGWQNGEGHAIITPPVTTNCKMTLTSGAIEPSTSVNTTPDNMETAAVSANASTASYTMLPLAASSGDAHKLTVTFKVKVQVGGRAEENRTYTATLTAPSVEGNGNTTAFQSGKNYTYTATLNPTAITFTGATVTDWTTVNTTDDLKPGEPPTI